MEVLMFHKIKEVTALPDFILYVQFAEGVTKTYDVNSAGRRNRSLKTVKSSPEHFKHVVIDMGGSQVSWNDGPSLSCDELFDRGKKVDTPFDGLMAFTDATELWGLNESTLRKAIEYGKLVRGVDACKFGKQWVISVEAMEREYGKPLER